VLQRDRYNRVALAIEGLENLMERIIAVSDKDWITDEDLPYELHVAQLDAEGPSTETCSNAPSRRSSETFSSARSRNRVGT
jgi:DNA-binding NtrC family response regulator